MTHSDVRLHMLRNSVEQRSRRFRLFLTPQREAFCKVFIPTFPEKGYNSVPLLCDSNDQGMIARGYVRPFMCRMLYGQLQCGVEVCPSFAT